MKENIVELLRSIPNILTRSPIARRFQLQAMAMAMRWMEMGMMNYGGGEAVDLPRGVFLMQSENSGSLCGG